jgi:hypothetical protein
MKYEDKFIAFVDILGFASAVENAEGEGSLSLAELRDATKLLGSDGDVEAIRTDGPTICPCAPRYARDVGFELTQTSDCVIVSAEVSPSGAITIVNQCYLAVFRLLENGLMCRGHVRRGKIYHRGHEFIGPGFQDAYKREGAVSAFKQDAEDRGTPFVELDPSIRDYVAECGDECVVEMYERMVKRDTEVDAIFPFNRLSNFITIGAEARLDVAKEKNSINNLRRMINNFRSGITRHVDTSNESAVRKFRHYESALVAQLNECDRLDSMVDMLAASYPSAGISNENDGPTGRCS